MLRVFVCAMTVLAFACAGTLVQAQNKATDNKTTAQAGKKKHDATITKVDAKKGTITVHMKDKAGKETDKTFKLTEDIRYFDSTGRVAAIDVFQSGNEVLFIEAEGKLKELHKKDKTQK